MLEVSAPDNPDDVLSTFHSDTPFQTIQVGNLLTLETTTRPARSHERRAHRLDWSARAETKDVPLHKTRSEHQGSAPGLARRGRSTLRGAAGQAY
jgi:hypothetical protein